MSGQTWLVAKNTYLNRVKGIGFWAMVLSPFLLVALYLGVGFFVGSGFNETSNIGVVDNPALTQALKQSEAINADLSDIASLDEAKSQLTDDEIDGYLIEKDGKYVLTASSSSSSKISESSFIAALSQVQMQENAMELGLSPVDLGLLLSPADFSLVESTSSGEATGGGEMKKGINMAISTITSILIFMMLMLYTSIIAQEIANEKSNRIMETLLAATSSNVQYYGKIVGVILLALTQIVFYVIGFAVAYPFIKDMEAVTMVKGFMTGIDFSFLIYLGLMSFVGILGYLFLASIVASLVNDQSQAQQATQPIVYLSMIGYIGGIVGGAASESLVLRILSFIPFISPTLMTSRYAVEYASMTEAYLSLLLQVVATVAIAKLGERVYARNVLSYSDDKILRQFFNNLRGKSAVK